MEELLAPLLSGALGGYGGIGSGNRTPLSTPDLHLLLDRMQVMTEEIKDRVYTTVRLHYQEFVELTSRASEAAFDVEVLLRELQAVVKDTADLAAHEGAASGPAFDSRLWQLATEVQTVKKKLSVKQSALSLVQSTTSVRDDILAAKELFSRGLLVQGATKMAELRKALCLPTGKELKNEGNQLVLHSLLKELWMGIFWEVESLLEDLFSQAVCIDNKEGVLTVTSVKFPEARVDITAILEAMDILGLLDVTLSRFADAISKSFDAVVHDPSRAVAVNRDSECAVLRWFSKRSKQVLLSPEEVYERVLQMVKFIHQYVVNHRQSWMSKLGALIWPRLADAIIESCLRKAIPVDFIRFQDFQTIQRLTLQFEKELQAENFVLLKAHGGKLSHFASDMEAQFATNQRKQVLAKARQLIVEFDYGLFLKTTAKLEEKNELMFKKEEYYVSYLPKQLLSIVHEILKDFCSCTPRIAFELYQAARDVMLLFRAVVPVQFAKSMLQAAPLCHNDCLYIAHELLALAYQYNSSLPLDLRQTCTFVDLVPLFQSMAEKVFLEQLRSVRDQLMQILDTANGFKSTDETRNRETASLALQQVVSVLKSVQRSWHDFMPKAVETKLLPGLVDAVIKRIVFQVLSLDDMVAEETVQLHKLLEDLMVELNPVLSSAEDSSSSSLPDIVPSWRKLKGLADILDMSLIPITKAWEDGELRSAGFSPEEVKKMIRVIFTDTSLRAECLQRIR